MRSIPSLAVVFLLAMLTGRPAAAEFYISLTGDDANSGNSSATAWRSVQKVNARTFSPGDRISFEGGGTFVGNLTLNGSGQAQTPISLGSYGRGRALIDAGNGTGLATNGGHIWVNNLDFKGAGRKTGNGGNGILARNANGVRIDSVTVRGFQHTGVAVSGGSKARITHVHALENGFAGITLRDNDSGYIGWSVTENNPGDPTVTSNHSGSGIIVQNGARRVLVEYCESFNNGWDMQQSNFNGPVGIWTHNSDSVTIQYCISHNNRAPPDKTDGGGFDIDGGALNTTLQYNYSYDNGGTGYLFCTYSGSGTVLRNATMRYNISENDGQLTHRAGITFYDCCNTGFPGTEIHNNVIYNSAGRHGVGMSGASVGKGATFRNNIFLIQGNGRQVENPGQAVFQGNCYWTVGGGFAVGDHRTLESWADAGQERVNGRMVGMNVDPGLTRPGAGEKLKDPSLLPTLSAYRLLPASPMIDHGIDLRTVLAGDPGGRDFFGGNLPPGDGWDIGVHEFGGSSRGGKRPGKPQALMVFSHDAGASLDALGRLGRSEAWLKLFRTTREMERRPR